MYARCDVAGVFKSTDRGETWNPINKGMTQCHHHSVESFAISTHNPNILFRASGEARGNRIFGDIHKSKDGGASWYNVLDTLDYAGNGPNRMLGEMISIDPYSSRNVVAGGFSNGLYRSTDEGETWQYVGLNGEPIGFVAHHPYVKDLIYVGTLGSIRYEEYLFPNGGNNRPDGGKLFESTDGGKTFELIYSTLDSEFGDIAFSSERPGTLVIAMLGGGVQTSRDFGRSFQKSMNGLPKEGIHYNTIAADPNIPGTYYTAPSRRGHHLKVPLVPLYKSTDYGASWSLIKAYQESDFSDYPKYIKNREFIGWAISKVRVDVERSDRLYMSNWFGVSVSNNGGQTWNGNQFRGTETICAEAIISDPNNADITLYTMADHQPAFSDDQGETYRQFIKRIPEQSYFPSSTAIAASRYRPGLIVYGLTERGSIESGIRVSVDFGRTAKMVKLFEPGLFVQAIKESTTTSGVFYAYVDGDLSKGAGLYKSIDFGESWTFIKVDFPGYIDRLPYQKNWIESELLSIVFNQVKNVCGTNQLLAVDPKDDNTVYIGEWTEGLFRTQDGGKTWMDISGDLPFKREKSSVLNAIYVDPKDEESVFAGFIREGLWYSKNRGKSWTKIYPKEDAIFNASALELVQKDDGKTVIYMASEPLYWSQSPSQVLMSDDYGKTWVKIYDGELGALRWKGITANPKTGRVHGVTAGNGVFFADPKSQNL